MSKSDKRKAVDDDRIIFLRDILVAVFIIYWFVAIYTYSGNESYRCNKVIFQNPINVSPSTAERRTRSFLTVLGNPQSSF